MTINQLISINEGELTAQFKMSGDLFELNSNGTMLNQLNVGAIDPSIMNLYLRKFEVGKVSYTPLIGLQSASQLARSKNKLRWTGVWEDIAYSVTFSLTNQAWFWNVEVEGQDVTIDIVYGQDIGLADKGTVQSNESYNSQYLDHVVVETEASGYIICSRQNQPQSDGNHPYLQQGALSKTAGYSTDGFQFFGKSYKTTNEPAVLIQEHLANEIYQYEMAYSALQSEQIALNGKYSVVFYGYTVSDHPEAITKPVALKTIQQLWEETIQTEDAFTDVVMVKKAAVIGESLKTQAFTKTEVENYFPKRLEEEYEGETLLSFFTAEKAHVVLQEKEQLMERPHGHILLSGAQLTIAETILTTTAYMYGIFNSQVVMGNTSNNKLISNVRNDLNIPKTAGQRLYVELDGIYHLLTMPSAFEMGFNYAIWYYKLQDDVLKIKNYTTIDGPELFLEVESENNKTYRFVVTNQVIMNEIENRVPYSLSKQKNQLEFRPEKESTMFDFYPELSYTMTVDGAEFALTDEQFFLENSSSSDSPLVALKIAKTAHFTIAIQGRLEDEKSAFVQRSFPDEVKKYNHHFKQVMNGFALSINSEDNKSLDRVNILAWWYTHNMLVHYLMPHGLEQYGGAAWGTRDVMQGPTEYFMATQNYSSIKAILRVLFANQFADDGNWPQWFMFDRYTHLKAKESHGDVIVWPLKVIGDYLSASNDHAFLDETIVYTDRETCDKTEQTATVFEHIVKAIDYIKQHLLEGTNLPGYGDGDWDDTLQPYDSRLKSHMASSWTVALMYQSLKQLADVLNSHDPVFSNKLKEMYQDLEADYKKYMLSTDVIPGFVFMEEPDKVELMIHPTDTRTGIAYRLLPMQQSMIAELFSPEEAEQHYQVIKNELSHPDGVRLMSEPARYDGGVSTYFKRAEQAANFGREVGLQYVHAHIRFAEAMAKIGKRDEAWHALAIVNPINIKTVVPNAQRRQSNAYFSSSDGAFKTRYEAAENFSKLRDGTVDVKGGWRIYSSGPGIYMNQLITNILGIRATATDLTIDPVLPDSLNGLVFEFELYDKPIKFYYHLNNEEPHLEINQEKAAKDDYSNRYRSGGFIVLKAEVEKWLKDENNRIDIYL
ncbi:putative lysine transport system substrate-binding protein [Carnobacterium alterfunditum]|uniref:Putative lysine transport system substrate-binding protein n=1 Tax=Carnobacterium alterfunditum TaxID=28230 RepID=A0A1N6HEU9_9LACT|nr:cellobiose phosphorylase [Carnobacterium alterfunditum]SIO18237.1 putative lysine transport system substrate-binding protein [Carnobacterium alterfunditum]